MENNEYATFCECGCGNGVHLKAYKEDGELSVQLVSNNFYSGRKNIKNSLKEKLKRIWYIIANKEYCYFEILIHKNELQKFKDFVAKL